MATKNRNETKSAKTKCKTNKTKIIYNVQLYKNANYKWASAIKMLEKAQGH